MTKPTKARPQNESPDPLTNPVLTDGSIVCVGKKHFLEILSQSKFKGDVKDGSVNHDKYLYDEFSCP